MSKRDNIVWHLTHTDLRVDFRIQKAMEATRVSGSEVVGISFSSHAGYRTKDTGGNELLGFVVPLGKKTNRTEVDKFEVGNGINLEIASRRASWAQKLFMIPFATGKLLIKTRRERPNAIWVHDFPLLIPGLLVSSLSKSKLIYDAHELNGHAAGHTGLWSSLILFGQKLAWKYISGFITVSESIRQWYLETYGPKHSIVVTNSPMNEPLENAGPKQASVREALQISQEQLIFCYLGAIEPGRNIETLLRIFAKPERTSVIVFVGEGSLKSEIVRFSETVASIRHHHPVQNWKIAELLSEVDYGFVLIEPISLSDRFSLPNKLFEYLESGVIPIGSKLPEIQRVISESGTGHVVDTSEKSLEELIWKLERLGAPSSRAVLLEMYSWKAQRSLLASFVARLLDRVAGP